MVSQKLQSKSTIIVNAVKDEFYDVKRNPQKHLMISCGRLEKQKNYPLLIDAFGEVTKDFLMPCYIYMGLVLA